MDASDPVPLPRRGPATPAGPGFGHTPVRVATHVPVVVRAGIVTLLRPHAHRVEVLGQDARSRAQVEVFDPDSPGPRVSVDVPRVALTWDVSAAGAARARALGAVRVLPLSTRVEGLLAALEQAHRTRPVEVVAPACEAGPLSPREVDVVRGICRGLSNDEIAEELYLSVNSVKTYIRTAYRKMGVASRSQAVLWGLAQEL